MTIKLISPTKMTISGNMLFLSAIGSIFLILGIIMIFFPDLLNNNKTNDSVLNILKWVFAASGLLTLVMSTKQRKFLLDKETGTVTIRKFFMFREQDKTVASLKEIKKIYLQANRRRMSKGHTGWQCFIYLVTADENRLPLEEHPIASTGTSTIEKNKKKAEQIAAFIGVPLEMNNPLIQSKDDSI
jgi:hypothetical protein